MKPPSNVATPTSQPRIEAGVQGTVAHVDSILAANEETLKPTSPPPGFRPTPIYALVRKKEKPSPASKSKEPTRKETPKEHELRLGPIPPNQHKKGEGNIEQIIPGRKDSKEETD